MSTPTFLLPPCPVCSHRKALERPSWKLAHRTSTTLGVRAYLWMGCKHAQTVRSNTPVSEPAEFQKTEEVWANLLPGLLTEKTKGWTEAQRTDFSRVLEDRAYHFSQSQDSLATTHETTNDEPGQNPL